MRWYPVVLIAGMLLLLGFNAAHGQTIPVGLYLSPTGSDATGTGAIDNPYRTFKYAISQASDWDTVVALPGTYFELVQISFSHPVHIAGYEGAANTTVSGDFGGIVFDYQGSLDSPTARVSLIGLTITRGQPHGVQVVEWDILIKDCVIEDCQTELTEGNFLGAGIYLLFSLALIDNCTVQNNRATFSGDSGGGICAEYSAPTIRNCRILNNTADDYGGGIYLRGNIFESNAPMIVNSIVRDNAAMGGAGITVDSYSWNVYVINNLIAGNIGGEYASGILIQYGSDSKTFNNIIAYNSQDGMISNESVGALSGYNCYYSNGGSDYYGGSDMGFNQLVNPQFVNYAAGDYHLQELSPIINKGYYIDSLPSVDFDGQKRIVQSDVDIGPDEFADCSMTANFGANPTSGCEFMLVNFTGTVTGLYDSLMWDFGDGSFSYNTLNVQKPYSEVGTYTVKLYAITPCTTVVAIAEDLITVGEPPTANFSVDIDSGCAPLLVQFSDLSVGNVTSWLWNFGDGTTSVLPTPSHEYQSGGIYTVRLIVANVCDIDTIIRTNYITVGGSAEADFLATTTAGSAPLTVNFVDQSRNDPTEWEWDFGDGGSSALQNPTHQYTKPGIYDVQLTVTNECESYDTWLLEGYIRAYGFDLRLADTSHTRYVKTFSFDLDSLYGPFDRNVTLRAKLLSTPQRGTAKFTIQDSTMAIGNSSSFQATLSKDLWHGIYQGALIGTAAGGSPIDTLLFEFESTPIQLVATSADSVKFDSTQIGSTAVINLIVRNQGALIDNLNLNVRSIPIDGSDAFFVTPTAFTVFPASSRPVQIWFTPPDSGYYTADITIMSDDPVMSEYVVHLEGLGIPERIPPYVDYTDPAASATGVMITEVIDLFISEPLDTLSLPEAPLLTVGSGWTGSTIAGKTVFIGNLPHQWIVRFVPDTILPPLDLITVTLNGDVVDLAGNSLDGNLDGVAEGSPIDDAVFQFETGPGVYPGDANNDGVVNEVDVLPLGVFWMMTGPDRAGGTEWRIQPAEVWTEPAATYADCNGDSTVNMQDLLVIAINWGSTHSYGSPQFVPGDYDLAEYKGAFETIFFALGESQESEFTRSVRDLIAKYVEVETVPGQYMLSQNFPNPFNPTTYIQFNLPVDGHVSLTVHNILGQTVATLVDEFQTQGFKQVMWNGTSDAGEALPSGMYFYRMKAGTFTQVKKMLMIR